MTPSGTEPATFRFVAQHLNRGPQIMYYKIWNALYVKLKWTFNEFINNGFLRPEENVNIQWHKIIPHEGLQELSEAPVCI